MRARSMKIGDLAVHKVATIPSGTSLLNCAKEMRENCMSEVSWLLMRTERPIGMLTDRDITIS